MVQISREGYGHNINMSLRECVLPPLFVCDPWRSMIARADLTCSLSRAAEQHELWSENREQHRDVRMSIKLRLRDERTNERTDWRRESNLVHFSLKMWRLEAIVLVIFLIISSPNFVYLLVDPGFLSLLLNFYDTSRFVPPWDWRTQKGTNLNH